MFQLLSRPTELIAQPAGVHYNRGVGSLKPVSEKLAKTLITLETYGIL